ncbi:MAG: peptidylprolyl isomerase [Hyphomicrobiales bacterium]
MVISNDKVASLIYTIRIGDSEGDILETISKETPKDILFGYGRMLPGVESKLMNLKADDTFDFTLPPEEAFGSYMKEAIIDLPRAIFQEDGKEREDLLQVGKEVQMVDNEGMPIQGIMLKIEEETVTMDFNHPLAGNSIHVAGEILSVRDAEDADFNFGCGCSDGENCGCSDENSDADCGCSEKGSCGC